MPVVSFDKDAKVTLSDILIGSAVGALGAGLIILGNKVDILDHKFRMLLGLTECNTLLIQSLNKDIASMNETEGETEEVES